MTTATSPKVVAYGALGAIALAVGLLGGHPALVAFAAPWLLFGVVALRAAPPAAPEGRLVLGTPRTVEAEPVDLRLELAPAAAALGRVDLALPAVAGLDVDGRVRSVPAGAAEVRFGATAARWGAHRIAPVGFRSWDALGVRSLEGTTGGPPQVVRVYPRAEAVRGLVAPMATRALTGSRRSRARGDGIEYADVRPYAPGDPLRRVNWRASGRGRGLFVVDRHPDRNADVVVVVDAFADHAVAGARPADDVVRLGAAVAAGYLRERDRVGVVGLSGGIWWLRGSLGVRQLYRIADALIESQAARTFAYAGMDAVDRRVLSAGAFVVFITPLADRRSAEAVHQLHAGGHDVVVLEVSPDPYLPPRTDPVVLAARRVWAAMRAAQRDRLRAEGIVVVTWTPERRLEDALMEVSAWRRRGQRTVSV